MKTNWELNNKKYRRVRWNNQKKWDPKNFPESPVSQKLLRYFDTKFLESVSLIALLKCLAVVSCKLERPRVSLLHVAPSRNLKTYTSNEVMKIFDDKFWLDLQSDFTLNSLKRYKKKLNQSVCLFVNDATTLFASKAKRFKDRLVGGLSGLLADGIYIYQDFKKKFTLKGKVTSVMNMTSEAYRNYKNRLLGLTFTERVLTLHHVLSKPEMNSWVAKEEKTRKMRFKPTITINDIETDIEEIPRHYLKLIKIQAREFSCLSLRSFIACQDLIKGTVRAHASLNNRKGFCTDDFALVPMIKGYLINPFSPYEGQIVKYSAQGLSYRGICKKIGKPNYIHQVQSVVKKAQIRGILPLETKSEHDMLNEKASTCSTELQRR